MNTFRIVQTDPHNKLIELLIHLKFPCVIEPCGNIEYSEENTVYFETVLSVIRYGMFCSHEWQLLFVPNDRAMLYAKEMNRRKILFYEEIHDGGMSFILPRKYHPLSWKI